MRCVGNSSSGMVGLDALPLPARPNVVQFLRSADALRALPQVSRGTLAALKVLRLSGKYRASTVEEAVRQAHALHRCCDLHTLIIHDNATDVSALARIETLHTLDLAYSKQLKDVSATSGRGIARAQPTEHKCDRRVFPGELRNAEHPQPLVLLWSP
mmetsp:Transcript_5221/g.16477  ORF Transcript_5221/g.16477 Transcript_5221/m.16477 type:complete len:157 (-) Transcript_5221:411-881(-)